MRYIGSKKRILDFITNIITNNINCENKIFCDLFSGTSIVSQYFKNLNCNLIVNDLEYYAFILAKGYIENNEYDIEFIKYLNELEPVDGLITEYYADKYFSKDNARKADAIRIALEKNKDKNYYFYLASIIEAIDKVANNTGQYSAYLKHIKTDALKPLIIKPIKISFNEKEYRIYNEDANSLIQEIEGDILYLDPPYNRRQYGSNYHVLNLIAKYKRINPQGKTLLPEEYNKSKYCSKINAKNALFNLIENADFKHIFISYNNEGIIQFRDFEELMKKYNGKYFTMENQRYTSTKDNYGKVIEYIFYLNKM